MICESCGREVQPGEKFCQSCGAEIVEKKDVVETAAPATETAYTVDAPTSQIMESAKKAEPAVDKPGFAIAGLVLGIVSAVAWLLMILISYITGIVGIIMSVKGLKTSRKNMAIAGLILNIIGLVLAVAFHCLATCLAMSLLK